MKWITKKLMNLWNSIQKVLQLRSPESPKVSLMCQENLEEYSGKSQKKSERKGRPTIQVKHDKNERLAQGDFYSDITIIESYKDLPDKVVINEINYPLSVLISQDCDLNSDARSRKANSIQNAKINNDKDLLWLVFAPVYIFEQFLLGDHLSELGMKMSQIQDNTLITKITQNDIPRFHYLRYQDSERLPEMIIDFKHAFTISNEAFLSQTNRKFEFQALPLFREALSQRYAYYLSRIGLPVLPRT